MQLEWDEDKEVANVAKHGLDFSFAAQVLSDRLGVVIYDRFENGEHRYHAIGLVGWKCLVLVHSYPNPDDDRVIRVIGLRDATTHERRRYEESDFD